MHYLYYLISLYIQIPNLNVQTFGCRHKYLLRQIHGFHTFACSFALQEKDSCLMIISTLICLLND